MTENPKTMQGTRITYDGTGELPGPGTFWKDARDGNWFGMTPNGHLAGFANHHVVEHEDGTISVDPSILTRTDFSRQGAPIDVNDGNRPVPKGFWHGYLERGVWREC